MQTATEFEEQWQDFLLNGMPGWLPQAFSVATQYPKVKPRDVLGWMISEWVSPEHLRQLSDGDIMTGLKVVAQAMGTKFVA